MNINKELAAWKVFLPQRTQRFFTK